MCRCFGVMRNTEPKLTRGEASHTVGVPPKQPHASYSFPLPRYTVGYMELLGISDCNVNLLCVLEVVILWLRPPKICSTIYPNNRHVTFSTEA